MWIPYNPNPLGLKVGDCTVRAICAATNASWDDVHKALCDLSRDMADMPSADRCWWALLEDLGFTRRRMIDRCPNACFARYQVTFNGNIALPDGATVGPISIALAIDGEPIQTSRAIVTPTVVDSYFNVTSTAIVTVPKGCCFSVAVENTSAPAAAGGAAPEINVQNANLTVSRIA